MKSENTRNQEKRINEIDIPGRGQHKQLNLVGLKIHL